MACMWRSRFPIRARACRRTGCRSCCVSTASRPSARGGSGAPAWAWRSARDWWRPAEAASGRRAAGRGSAPGSPSLFRRLRRPPTPHRPRQPRKGRVRPCILVVDDDPQTLRHVRYAHSQAAYDPVMTGDPGTLPGLVKTYDGKDGIDDADAHERSLAGPHAASASTAAVTCWRPPTPGTASRWGGTSPISHPGPQSLVALHR